MSSISHPCTKDALRALMNTPGCLNIDGMLTIRPRYTEPGERIMPTIEARRERALHCLRALADAFCMRYDMNATEAKILFHTAGTNGVAFSDLPIKGSKRTRAMDTLRGYGLVDDGYDPDNRKQKIAYITPKGRRFVDELVDILTPH